MPLFDRVTIGDTHCGGETFLESTASFDAVGLIMGICERAVLTTLAILLLKLGMLNEPLVVENAGVMASVAGGWIALKTVVGWRRVIKDNPAIVRLSMVGVTGRGCRLSGLDHTRCAGRRVDAGTIFLIAA